MKQFSHLTVDAQNGRLCFGSLDVPASIENEVSNLLANTGEYCQPSTKSMLKSATRIAGMYPTYICAQYALGSVILSGNGKPDAAIEPLTKAWNYGSTRLAKQMAVDLHYSASQGNASLLNAGARLAQLTILGAGLAQALQIAGRVHRWDIEHASGALSIKAHIEQLIGDKNAAITLKSAATQQDPKAFYALGLEYLREHKASDAVTAFSQGIRYAPEVAEILLGRELARTGAERRNVAATQQYVETFCLSEWTATELATLSKVARRTADSKW